MLDASYYSVIELGEDGQFFAWVLPGIRVTGQTEAEVIRTLSQQVRAAPAAAMEAPGKRAKLLRRWINQLSGSRRQQGGKASNRAALETPCIRAAFELHMVSNTWRRSPMKCLKLCLIAGMAAGLPLPGAVAAAPMSDTKYCDALIGRYNAYAANLTEWRRTGRSNAGEVRAAIANCKAGDTAAGIPTLEKALRNIGIGLPARS
jgi:hypothetical protein